MVSAAWGRFGERLRSGYLDIGNPNNVLLQNVHTKSPCTVDSAEAILSLAPQVGLKRSGIHTAARKSTYLKD